MFGIIASIIDGVLVGLVYGLAAMGLTLIWGVMDVINLTHGTMIVAGMMALYLISDALGVSPYFTLPPILIGGFFVGFALYWIAVHRMMGRPPLMSLLSTFSVNLVLVGLGTAVWGTALFNVEVSLPGLTIDRYTFPGPHILAAVLAAVIASLLYLFLHYARLGKALRAVANNREAAELVGIPTTRVLAIAVGCGVALAGVSGVVIGTLLPMSGDTTNAATTRAMIQKNGRRSITTYRAGRKHRRERRSAPARTAQIRSPASSLPARTASPRLQASQAQPRPLARRPGCRSRRAR